MSTSVTSAAAAPPSLLWDVFCRVIDNLGDIGVCWRLCANLAAQGQRVRLWIDQPDDLRWMAPGALVGAMPGMEIVRWTDPMPAAAVASMAPADVWIEAFGCDPDTACIVAMAQRLQAGHPAPVWLNVEYMSAEAWVERCHGLPSPVMSGPMKGATKWFFYPGFTHATGGLLREPDLLSRQAAFDADSWRRTQGLSGQTPGDNSGRSISLFCYEPPALPAVLRGAGSDPIPSHWLVTPGRAAAAMEAALTRGDIFAADQRIHRLPYLTQIDYDHLLWSCDLNFVRGEDSLVRAIWAGRPFVWHIYPQHDNAHHAKLDAFLDWLQAPPSWRRFHHAWNGMTPTQSVWPGWETIDSWRDCVLAARQRLLSQDDLCQQLLGFVMKKR